MTASLTSISPSAPYSLSSKHKGLETTSIHSAPRAISFDPNTPPLTPNATPEHDRQAIPFKHASPTPLDSPPSTPPTEHQSPAGGLEKPVSDLLYNLFPRSALAASAHAKSVAISEHMNGSWDAFTLQLPGEEKTLYVDGRGAEQVSLRESIVALLDLADEHLGCSAFVIALDRRSPSLGQLLLFSFLISTLTRSCSGDLLHALMYVGGTVVTKPPFAVDPAYVLVGIEV